MEILNELVATCDEQVKDLNKKIEQLTIQRNNERTSKESLSAEISELTASYAVTREQLSVSKSSLKIIINDIAEVESSKKH